jgi:diaminohydroxyphosphoribosylaminopyrimidine deaminase/5-amino-6-(5-phosphoribosylamino)uracil reductase
VAAGISRVIAATEDPNPLVSGRGIEFLQRHGIDVSIGVGRARASRLNRPYFTLVREQRPFVILKAAVSRDNRVARKRGERSEISSPESRLHAHRIRAEVDAIAVGSETVLIDDPFLTPRLVPRTRPLTRVLFDRRLRISTSARVFSTLDAGPVIIVTTPESVAHNRARVRELEQAGAVLEPIAGGELGGALSRLADREVMSLLLEGGVALQTAAWEAGLVDAVHLYRAPASIGPGGVLWIDPKILSIEDLVDRTVRPCGPDIFMEAYVHGVD